MLLMRVEGVLRIGLGALFGLVGGGIWAYQGGTGPALCASGGALCFAAGVTALLAPTRAAGLLCAGAAAIGYGLLWAAAVLLWRELAYDKAGHYLAYITMTIGRLVSLAMLVVLLCASALWLAATVRLSAQRRPPEPPDLPRRS